MKLRFLILGFFLPLIAHAQERGVGIRLGEPLSITYRDFWKDLISFEVMIGMAGANNSSYYQNSFINKPPTQNTFYLSQNTERGISLNLRTAIHQDFTDQIGIQSGYVLGYLGFGAQIRAINVTYIYSVISPGTQALSDPRTNLDLGSEFFGGSEYYFDNYPISIFAEAGLFLEIFDLTGHIKGQGGIGIKYLF